MQMKPLKELLQDIEQEMQRQGICRDMKSLPPERITMATLSAELITEFL